MKGHSAIFFRDFKNSYIPDILEEVYMKKIYDPYLAGKTDLIIADFGANIGLTSLYFKDYAKEVYAVEPSKQHQETIKMMLDFNEIKNVKLCPYAISNKNGTTKFYHNENVTMFSLSDRVNGDKDYEEVETVTMDEFMKRNKLDHLDFLKLDIEGFECEFVASDEFKKWAPKIEIIAFEYHNWSKCELPQFINTLKDLGYEVKINKNTRATTGVAIMI